jgi:hypothetical protein
MKTDGLLDVFGDTVDDADVLGVVDGRPSIVFRVAQSS